MDHLTKSLISLIVSEKFPDESQSLYFINTHQLSEQLLRDLKDTFTNFGYEQARGVFWNEVSA